MPNHQHRATISPPRSRRTSPIRTWPIRPYPSTGAATRRRPLTSSCAAPVLIDPAFAPADDEVDSPSVLFIHGQSESPLIWLPVLSLLRESGLPTRTVRHRDDRPTGGEVVDEFANAAALGRLLDEQGRAPSLIVGHGGGAALALALAATAPRHVRALVLVAPAAGLPPIRLTDRMLASPVIGPALAWLGFRAAALAVRIGPLRRVIATKVVGSADTEPLARQLADRRAWRTFVTKQRRLVTYARCLHRGLSRLDCPLFIVSGHHEDKGRLIPIDDPHSVAAAILRARRISHHPVARPRTQTPESSPS